MDEYVKLDNIPPRRLRTWIPWDKVRAMPEGQALDLTPLLDGRSLEAARSSICGSLLSAIKRGDAREGDHALRRDGKLYIVRPERSDA